MAKVDYVVSQLNALAADVRNVFGEIFQYVLRNLRLGRAGNGVPSENLQAYYFTAKTPAIANTQFQIAHGLATVPYLALPVLDLTAGNAVMPQLTVTKPADSTFIYLSSPVVGVTFTILVEA